MESGSLCAAMKSWRRLSNWNRRFGSQCESLSRVPAVTVPISPTNYGRGGGVGRGLGPGGDLGVGVGLGVTVGVGVSVSAYVAAYGSAVSRWSRVAISSWGRTVSLIPQCGAIDAITN